MNKAITIGIIRVIASLTIPFINALWLMLISGAILGHYKLWTPSYWDTVGVLYSLIIVSSVIARNAYYIVKGNIKSDDAYEKIRSESRKRKPLI